MNPGIENALKRFGQSYDIYEYIFDDWEVDDEFKTKFREQLKNGYDRVLSVNFSPLIAEVCNEMGISYVSWVYDSPMHIRNTEAMKYPVVTIYNFDGGEVLQLQKQGICAKHLPLAVDVDVFGKTINKNINNRSYDSEITLLGKLYNTDYNYYLGPLSEHAKGMLEGIIAAQSKVQNAYIIPESIPEMLLTEMNECYAKASNNTVQINRQELQYMLGCEVTARERYIILSLLAKHFPVRLYSNEKNVNLKNVEECGYADYYSQMPCIFHNSKINLNITLRTIRTGIPLRVIDILGCRGLALMNMQEEAMEYFAPGEELVMYQDIGDLYEKAAFYLKEDELRKKIIERGYERVKRDFNFDERVRILLQ